MRKYRKKECIHCGKDHHNLKFCSSKCSQEYRFKQLTVTKLDNTEDFSVAGVRAIRKYLIFKSGNVCSICGTSKWNGENIPLILDHIDGNSDNWFRTNIRIICPNCDALLPTYKAKNKGNGRFARRQRYAEGKSY